MTNFPRSAFSIRDTLADRVLYVCFTCVCVCVCVYLHGVHTSFPIEDVMLSVQVF